MKTKKPRKQRKRQFKPQYHKKKKQLSVNLSEEFKEEFETRNIPVRTGDEVKVMRGEFKGVTGKIREINQKNQTVTIENVTREKTDGTEVHIPLKPSNLTIVDPDMSDRMRRKIIERVGGEVKEELKEKITEEKPEEEKEEKKEKGFKCEVCGEIFDSKRGLNIHKGQKHKEYIKGD